MADEQDDDAEPGLLIIVEIYDALSAGEPETALELAAQALEQSPDEDPVIRFLAGVALLDLDRPDEAVDELAIAVEFDPEEADYRSHLALALFRCCRFDEAAVQARAALEADPESADAHYVQGLQLERAGELEAAERHFNRASQIDDERFPPPARLSREAFEGHLAAAMDRLPEEYRRHLDRVAVTVEDLPSEDVLLDEEPPFDPESLLGLFVGVPVGESGESGELPPRILIFKRNLERLALDRDALVEEIAVTLYHELGHYLGLDEEELEEIDLG